MPYFEVSGAELCYQVVGKGPMILCISGANVSYDRWQAFSEGLQDCFTVVSYDRRGFSRSYLVGAQDYANRLETDADDAAALIKHICPNEPATVVGNSSGAIVSLKLLSRHTDLIRTLLCYEPPAAGFLPDAEYKQFKTDLHDAHNTYRESGPWSALEEFTKVIQIEFKTFSMAFNPRASPYVWGHTQYWFDREFLTYPLTLWDVEKELAPSKDKLVLVNGELSKAEPVQYQANVHLAQKLGLEVLSVPGEHVGYISHPVEFGTRVVEILKARDGFYA